MTTSTLLRRACLGTFALASAFRLNAATPLRVGSLLRGGASMSTAAAPQEKFRLDYTAPPYRIDRLSLDFDIHEEETFVTSTLTVRTEAGANAAPFELDGEELTLKSIELDGKALAEGEDYAVTEDGLSVLKPPQESGGEFELKTVVRIEPHKNTQLSGLYKSSGMYVTQCEAEGFRRITYFQDRPDVMATYEVRIEAEKSKYPLLLANGNEVDH